MNVKGIVADGIFRRLLKWHPWPWWISLNVRHIMGAPMKRSHSMALRLYLWAMRNGRD